MAPSEECVALFNNLREWDNEAVAAQLERNPELWSATRPKDMTVSYRQDMVWMLGEVAPTPLSVAVRMARKEDKKLGADMVESMLEVLSKQPDSYWKRSIYPPVTTPLHEAMFYGLGDIAIKLVKAGFRPDAKNKQNFTPMDMAENPSIGQRVLWEWKGKTDSNMSFEEMEADDATESDAASHGFQSTASLSNMASQASLFSDSAEVAVMEASTTAPAQEPVAEQGENDVAPETETVPVDAAKEDAFLAEQIEPVMEIAAAEPEAAPDASQPLQTVNESIEQMAVPEPSEPAAGMAEETKNVEAPAPEPMADVVPSSPTKVTRTSGQTTPAGSPTKASAGSPDKGLALFGKRQQAATTWVGAAPAAVASGSESPVARSPTKVSASPSGGDRGLSLFAARRKQIDEAAEAAAAEASALAASAPAVTPVAHEQPVAAAQPETVVAEAPAIESTPALVAQTPAPTLDSPVTPTTSVDSPLLDEISSVVKFSGVMAYLGQSQPDFEKPTVDYSLNNSQKQDSKFEVDVSMQKTESGISFEAEEMWASAAAAAASQLPPRIPLKTSTSRKSMTPKIDTSQRALREVAACNSSSSQSGSVAPASPSAASIAESMSSVSRVPGVPPNTPTVDLMPLTSAELELQVAELDLMIKGLPSSLSDGSSVASTPTTSSFGGLPPIANAPPNTPTTIAPPAVLQRQRSKTPPNTPTVATGPGLPQAYQGGLLGGVLSALSMPDLTVMMSAGSQPSSATESPVKTDPEPLSTVTLTADNDSQEASPASEMMPPITTDSKLGLDYDDFYVATNALMALSQVFPDRGALAAVEEQEAQSIITYTAPNPEVVKAKMEAEKAELTEIIQSGPGYFVGRFGKCDFGPNGLPDVLCPTDISVSLSLQSAEGELPSGKINVPSGACVKSIDFGTAENHEFSILLGDPDRLQATVYMTTKAQQKISLLSQDDFTSLVEAEKRKTGPAAMPPALPPRKDSQAILRQGSIASLRPPTLSHSVSVSSSMSYAQTERETLDVATEDLSSESTLLRSRASNYSSVSLADSTILKEEEDNTMVISQMPLALVERWCNSAGSIKAFSTGGPVNMLVETQALEQITIPPPMAPPRSPVHASGSGSGGAADDVEQKGGILKRFNSLVRKKKPEPSPFARTASVQSAGLVVTTHAVTRRSFFQFVAQPQIEGVWIPGTYAQPPTSLAECELWLGKIATKAIAEDDKVPEWVAAVAKMKQYGLL